MDDVLIKASTPDQARRNVQRTMSVLQQAGFVVNWEKSSHRPTRQLEHLGLAIDMERSIISLLEERLLKLRNLLDSVLEASLLDIMLLARLMGMLVSCQDVIPWACFHSRLLQAFLVPFQHLIERNQHQMVTLTEVMKQELSWWRAQGKLFQGLRFGIQNWVVVTTDASLISWGAHTEGEITQGAWSAEVKSAHINLLELWAVRLALADFVHLVWGQQVLIRADNITTKVFINKQGGPEVTQAAQGVFNPVGGTKPVATVCFMPSLW